jgi:hypothetical protein
MTAPTANKPPVNKPADTNKSAEKPADTSKPAENGKDERIPEAFSKNSILKDFCAQYLKVFDEISNYNREVLAEKDSEWNAGKVLEKAREFARPTEKGVEPKQDIKKAIEAYENAVNALAQARRSVLDITSKELGITLSATADRNPELEAPLKERRKLAIEIGTQLNMIAKLTTDEAASAAATKFLDQNPLPAIGRDQARSFGDSEKATPKYRVHVVVKDKDGATKVEEDGFTKTALALTKFYERGKALKSDDLREAWEKAGNSPDKTVTNPVEFTDNDLHFVISKK